MKTLAIAFSSFVLGLALSGFVAIKFFVYGAQSVSQVEIQLYDLALQSRD